MPLDVSTVLAFLSPPSMDGRIEDGVKSRVGWSWEVPSATGILRPVVPRGGILATGGVYWKAREFGVLADGAIEPDGGTEIFLMFIGEDMMEWSNQEQAYLVKKPLLPHSRFRHVTLGPTRDMGLCDYKHWISISKCPISPYEVSIWASSPT